MLEVINFTAQDGQLLGGARLFELVVPSGEVRVSEVSYSRCEWSHRRLIGERHWAADALFDHLDCDPDAEQLRAPA